MKPALLCILYNGLLPQAAAFVIHRKVYRGVCCLCVSAFNVFTVQTNTYNNCIVCCTPNTKGRGQRKREKNIYLVPLYLAFLKLCAWSKVTQENPVILSTWNGNCMRQLCSLPEGEKGSLAYRILYLDN